MVHLARSNQFDPSTRVPPLFAVVGVKGMVQLARRSYLDCSKIFLLLLLGIGDSFTALMILIDV